ncbi:hypothetical protein [Rhodovulum sp. 12E13]|uniref:hypothetical protein n=1 Tax=Rhodovulum sp. 12E13 TaxID=2203891 RepID=UPI0011C07FE7|nr:hypothetical protein [Rhodovulum sp. 12E13]
MKSIRHAAQNQSDWFYTCGNFLFVNPPIWIIRQERLLDDMAIFFGRSGMAEWSDALELEEDPVKAHRNDYSSTPNLSDKAKNNLWAWYAQDVEFYRACEEWMHEALGNDKE